MTETRQLVIDEVGPVIERFADSGFPVYLVGGIVRDLELGAGVEELDFDLTTPARPERIREIVAPIAEALWSQGERFGTIGAMIGGREYEITTHRAEWYEDDSRKPAVEFGDDIEADLSRRDFTVNAMAIRLPDGQLIDPFSGIEALRDRRLETPIDARISFGDDPLRILRAARFIARYEMRPSAALVTAASELVGRLDIVSAERIRDELDKVLSATRPSRGLRFLAEVGALPFVVTGIGDSDLDEVGLELDSADPDVELRRLILFQSLAAPERESAVAALRYSNDERRTMKSVLDALDEIRDHDEWNDEELRRLVARIGWDRVNILFDLCRTVDGVTAAEAALRLLGEREDLSDLDPVLTGDDVMGTLGLTEGRQVGFVLDALRERRLREGPATRDEELGFIVGLDVSN